MSDQPISVGGTMFDDAILSQPPTPQALVDVLGWTDAGIGYVRSDKSQDGVRLEADEADEFSDLVLWVQAGVCHRKIPTPATLRNVVILCERLGIPCEVIS